MAAREYSPMSDPIEAACPKGAAIKDIIKMFAGQITLKRNIFVSTLERALVMERIVGTWLGGITTFTCRFLLRRSFLYPTNSVNSGATRTAGVHRRIFCAAQNWFPPQAPQIFIP